MPKSPKMSRLETGTDRKVWTSRNRLFTAAANNTTETSCMFDVLKIFEADPSGHCAPFNMTTLYAKYGNWMGFFNERLFYYLGNEWPVAVVGVFMELGRRKDPFSLPPPQCLLPFPSCLSSGYLKQKSTHTFDFALMETVMSIKSAVLYGLVCTLCVLQRPHASLVFGRHV